MDLVTLASQVAIIFKMVVVLLVVNICWAVVVIMMSKKLSALEVVVGKKGNASPREG